MPNKQALSQVNMTVSEQDRYDLEDAFARLMKEMNDLKRRGSISKHRRIKKNDVTKLAFRIGMAKVRKMDYREFIDLLVRGRGLEASR